MSQAVGMECSHLELRLKFILYVGWWLSGSTKLGSLLLQNEYIVMCDVDLLIN
jgi:hypothetical protein